MTTLPPATPAPTQWQQPAYQPRVAFPDLSRQSVIVKYTFEVLAWIALVVGALAVVGLLIAASDANGSYYTEDETGGYIVAAVVAGTYTVFVWAGLRLSAMVAGHIANRNA